MAIMLTTCGDQYVIYQHHRSVVPLPQCQINIGGLALDDAAIVSAVIGMAKSLGLIVTAEGVETVRQLRFLQGINCGKMQGYYFNKPLPADEFNKLIKSGRELSQPQS
jgi:predicted signal transduction protein with EAL and GGDEF domain